MFRHGWVQGALACLLVACGDERSSIPRESPDAGSPDAAGAVERYRRGAGPPIFTTEAGHQRRGTVDWKDGGDEGGRSKGLQGGEGGIIDPNATAQGVCGNGLRTLDEECDDGNADEADFCTSACTYQPGPVAPVTVDPGEQPPARILGMGRHPVAAGTDGFAVAFLEPGYEPPVVSLGLFDPVGVRRLTLDVAADAEPVLFSDPVVAALPDGAFAVAFTEFGGDGDGLGIALRRVDADGTVRPLSFANSEGLFAQYDPDVVWTGSELIVAWTDETDLETAPDLRFRRFDEFLTPLDAADRILSASAGIEGRVSLTEFKGAWAASWRTLADGSESIGARTSSGVEWQTGSLLPGPADDLPSLIELDGSHLLLMYSVGADLADAGVANTPLLRGAVLDTNASGSVSGFDAGSTGPLASLMAADQVSQARVQVGTGTGRYYLGLRAPPSGDLGDEVHFAETAWQSSDPTAVSWTELLPLPRDPVEQVGDQRQVSFAATPLEPEGAMVAVWESYSAPPGSGRGEPDVLVQLMPVPVGAEPVEPMGLGLGEGDCNADSECQPGLICGWDDNMVYYDLNACVGCDACTYPHCVNGILDFDEDEVDCGGTDCGTCVVCPTHPNGHPNHCREVCRCGAGESDCDGDTTCLPGLKCAVAKGPQFGFQDGHDVCVQPHCVNGVKDADELGIDCGGADCGNCLFCSPNNGPNTCTYACRCDIGWGDCDAHAQCKAGLQCIAGIAEQFGLHASHQVCAPPHCGNGLEDTAMGETGVDCGGQCGACQPMPPDAATFVSADMPLLFTSGETLSVRVTMRNDGADSWDSGYTLSPYDKRWSWTAKAVEGTIAPGATFEFVFQVTAPLPPGSYDFTARLRSPDLAFFGPAATVTGVTVTLCGDGTVDAGEECDDGNRQPGDGCDESCESEPTGMLLGEGDCNYDGDCDTGLVCGYDNMVYYDLNACVGCDACTRLHCRNGVMDHDEDGVDCGGVDCGTCPVCPIHPNGHASHCRPACRCPAGESDCDSDSACNTGLKCGVLKGPQFGFPYGHDVCVKPHCINGVKDADELGIDCGGVDCGSCIFCNANAGMDTCTAGCRCEAGWGDCDGNAECKSGLQCVSGVSLRFGVPAIYQVCAKSHCVNGQQDTAAGETGVDCGGECGACQAIPSSSVTIMSTQIPPVFLSGETATLHVTIRNNGPDTWDSSYSLYRYNTLWSWTSKAVEGTVAPGQTFEFVFDVTAPLPPGSFSFLARMRSPDLAFFGPTVTANNITVTLCGNNVVDAGETCDDGNRTSGDGCSDVCATEP